MDIRGANKLFLPRGLIIGAIPDASRTFAKSDGLRGRTKVVTGAQETPRGSMWTYGAPMNSSGPEVL